MCRYLGGWCPFRFYCLWDHTIGQGGQHSKTVFGQRVTQHGSSRCTAARIVLRPSSSTASSSTMRMHEQLARRSLVGGICRAPLGARWVMVAGHGPLAKCGDGMGRARASTEAKHAQCLQMLCDIRMFDNFGTILRWFAKL